VEDSDPPDLDPESHPDSHLDSDLDRDVYPDLEPDSMHRGTWRYSCELGPGL